MAEKMTEAEFRARDKAAKAAKSAANKAKGAKQAARTRAANSFEDRGRVSAQIKARKVGAKAGNFYGDGRGRIWGSKRAEFTLDRSEARRERRVADMKTGGATSGRQAAAGFAQIIAAARAGGGNARLGIDGGRLTSAKASGGGGGGRRG